MGTGMVDGSGGGVECVVSDACESKMVVLVKKVPCSIWWAIGSAEGKISRREQRQEYLVPYRKW